MPEGAVTLALRLNFTSTSEEIKIGGIALETMPLPTSSSEVRPSVVPESHRLGQNYPNPFNPTTTIEYELQRAGRVELDIFDAMGNRVRTLVNREMGAGHHRTQWDGRDERGQTLASGSYFYQLRTDEAVGTKKMVLLK